MNMPVPDWNLATMFDAVARVVPSGRAAIVHAGGTVTWAELDARSNRLARALAARGHLPGERVGFLSRNHPGYIEGFIACLKARLIHVNINYRYTVDEVAGVLEDAGCTALLYHAEFGAQVAQKQQRLPGMVDTRMLDDFTPEMRRALERREPDGTAAAPHTIADAVAFFASEQAAQCHGQVLFVDGGKSVGMPPL